MAELTKLYAIFARKTSTVRKIYRFEAQVLKAAYPKHNFKLQAIPAKHRIADDVGNFDVESAFAYLRSTYKGKDGNPGPVQQVYSDREDFRKDFEACVAREAGTVDVDTGSFIDLMEIDGVGEDLAKELQAAGLSTIQEVAEADLDTLESVKGIGPSTAITIKRDAVELLESQLDPQE